ncbi:DMT family transporter [Xinfangfangia sp. CPCC 101601]|uniref:DMT family transporter n=1 Tax=Pseudogemmobacter lacusdianii TaxID=3069608 RepID=A0ABU0VXG8_9RHOB|nr:DMT family transporter [Xinfangfangia sp. CPCC 101601]MDQ2066455.1 DMT family transporter [Xinfangfangia sp. CPCC 101601]
MRNTRLGIWLMILTSVVFAAQDGISRHLAESYNIWMIVAIRFWAFSAVVILLALRAPGGIRLASHSVFPWVQLARGLILITEICVMILAFVKLGLIESHAVFTISPLLVAALSGPILGEKVGWRRWVAIGVGFIGVLIILNPGSGVLSIWALVPLAAAFLYAIYNLLTRYVAKGDSAGVSFFWTGVVCAVAITPFGLTHWEPMTGPDMALMAVLCCTAFIGHYMLIRAYALAEASAIQPFAYFQLVVIAFIGLLVFGEELRINVVIGAVIVVAAGVFSLWRQRVREKEAQRQAALAETPQP